MAKSKNGNGGVADLIAEAQSTVESSQTELLEARKQLVEDLERGAQDLASIDSALNSLGFNGNLENPNVSAVGSAGTKRRGRPKGSTAARGAGRPKGSGGHSMSMQDSICVAMGRLGATPDSDGVKTEDILNEVTAGPIAYAMSGNVDNHSNIISQNLSRLKQGGWIEQVSVAGRKRGLPYRLTADGYMWVQENAGTLLPPAFRTRDWVANPQAEDASDEE